MINIFIGPQRVRTNGSVTAPYVISCDWATAQSYIANPLCMVRSGRPANGSAIVAMLAGQFTVCSELPR